MKRATLAATLAFTLAPGTLAAQDGQFDLRDRATPTPEPTVVGPVDPENPVIRPRQTPRAAAPIEVPSATPTPATVTPSPNPADTVAQPRSTATRPASLPRGDVSPLPGPNQRLDPAPSVSAPPNSGALPSTRRPPAAYQPRNLDLVSDRDPIGLWLALGALALLLGIGGWLVWSRYFRTRAVAVAAPEIERPRVAQPKPEPAPARPAPAPLPTADAGLHLALQATRLSATLINTTLSYRLSLTNRGAVTVRDVRVDGDMVAAHASRRPEELFGPFAAVLPELHRVPALAPGESVSLTGEIRLPLAAITPIRRGNAAFFVPLARLRARGVAPTGVSAEGGGTYLVGQEPGANRKLQPFRLDLGPRNYSKLGQHLLPAA